MYYFFAALSFIINFFIVFWIIKIYFEVIEKQYDFVNEDEYTIIDRKKEDLDE